MRRLLVLALLAAPLVRAAEGGSVVGSRHDFSATGGGRFKGTGTTSACAYCHAPHGATGGALSSRPEPAPSRTAARLGSTAGAAGQSSRTCLSCHDGTVAVGQTSAGATQVLGGAGGRIEAGQRSNLGTDLRTTHPLSVRPDGLSVRAPVAGAGARLVEGGTVQCTSCHDPHRDSADGKFLLGPNRRSELCLGCHAEMTGEATHLTALRPTSLAALLPAGAAEAGCATCHASHGAAPDSHLQRRGAGEPEDATCLGCHGAGTGRLDVAADRAKPFAHASVTTGVHAADEGPTSASRRLPEASPAAPRHVVCVDCHAPHASNPRPASRPFAGGALDGVWGIDLDGQRVAQVKFEYQVCLKCHGDSANLALTRSAGASRSVPRAAADSNLRRVFSSSAASSHPVGAPGRNPDVPSLIAPLGPLSQITCSDCHASETGAGAGGAGPRGPHGSSWPALLERRYVTDDQVPESAAAYALCYKCHDRERLLSSPDSPFQTDAGLPLHKLHVVDQRASCSACHSAHGVSLLAGSPTANAHLVDFDTSVVGATPAGQRSYLSRGPRSGSCALTCHGSVHAPKEY